DAAREMADEGIRYAVVDLISLAILTFWRTYRSQFDEQGRLKEVASRAFAYLSRNLLADIAANALEESHQVDAKTVTCSDMVYLCYERARANSILLTEPLFRTDPYTSRQRTRGSDPSPDPTMVSVTLYPRLPATTSSLDQDDSATAGPIYRGLQPT